MEEEKPQKKYDRKPLPPEPPEEPAQDDVPPGVDPQYAARWVSRSRMARAIEAEQEEADRNYEPPSPYDHPRLGIRRGRNL